MFNVQLCVSETNKAGCVRVNPWFSVASSVFFFCRWSIEPILRYFEIFLRGQGTPKISDLHYLNWNFTFGCLSKDQNVSFREILI